MFGSKKRQKTRESQARLLAEQRTQVEQKFDADIKAAGEINDPAEKVIALKKLEGDIIFQISRERNAIYDAGDSKESKTLNVGGGTTTVATLGALGASVAFPPLIIAAGPIAMVGMVGSVLAAGKRANSTRQKLAAASKDHMENLEEKAALVSGLIKSAVKDNVEKISESPLYEDVLKLPGISDIFAVASAKHIKAVKEEAAEKAALEKKSATSSRKKSASNYSNLKGL